MKGAQLLGEPLDMVHDLLAVLVGRRLPRAETVA